MDQTIGYVITIGALIMGVMFLTGHGGIFMKGGNEKARAERYDMKKVEKYSGIYILALGVGSGADLFVSGLTEEIAYLVYVIVISVIYVAAMKVKCTRKEYKK